MFNWAYLHGCPTVSAQIKQYPEDFIVNEDLGFTFDGEGEHVLVQVKKTGCNTTFVADKLADFAQTSRKNVTYAGMKDRQAVTTQWFGLHMPGKETPDFSQFALEGCEILTVTRHRKKLRIGALKGNTFCLTLRDVSDKSALDARLKTVLAAGVPNYFGQQRFGRQGANIDQAIKWANGEITVKAREKRSFYLSAARSLIYNHIVSQRLNESLFDTILVGDAMQLTGRGSWFVAEENELDTLPPRLAANEILITAPLVGDDAWGTVAQALAFEEQAAAEYAVLMPLIRQARMTSARRAIKVTPQNSDFHWLDDCTLQLTFWLPAGSFATSVLRELVVETTQLNDVGE